MAVSASPHNLTDILLTAVILSAALPVCAQEQPVAAVMDFSRNGIMKDEMTVLRDILIFNLIETGEVIVVGRMEGNKLLRAAGYSNAFLSDEGNVKEIGKKLYADYIVGLMLDRDKNGYTLDVRVFDAAYPHLLGSARYTKPRVDDFMKQSRAIAADLLRFIPKETYRESVSDLVLESLSPVVVKERLLVVLPKQAETEEQAACKEALLLVIRRLLSHDRFVPFVAEIDYDETHIGAEAIGPMIVKKNCHYCALIREKSGALCFSVFDESCNERLAAAIGGRPDPDAAALEMIAALEDRLPLLSQETVIREVKKNILFEQKVEGLLFSERLFSKKFSFSLHQSLFTSVFVYYYIPNINIFSLSLDCYWYYERMFGVGAGYGVSLVYPATFESGLIHHPLVQTHEIRLVPFSFRTGGKLGFLVNLMTGLTFQNAFDIIRLAGDGDFELDSEHLICFAKTGIGLGISFNTSESFAISWGGLSFHYAIPVAGFTENNIAALEEINPFSIDIGGLGFIYRF
ncbi:MAG: hypothetical protein JW881_14510 [Spirochaetales bacterium]|nr:hypothetical protein [Spirochaetales bacterium]